MASKRAPKWALDRRSEQDSSKAARIAALYLLREEIADVPKTHLAAALGISRWTLDKDLAAMQETAGYMEKMREALQEEARQHTRV